MGEAIAGFREDTVDKEEPEVVKWIRPSFEKEWK